MISTIVGFAISMAFLFLMLSAACSAILEIVANLMRWRAKTLQKGLEGLLLSKTFRDKVYDTPLIKGLHAPVMFSRELKPPAYIPSTTLALAIMQAAEDVKSIEGSSDDVKKELEKTQKLLSALLRDCDTVEKQRKRLEDWFNDSMDRVSGWYKRKSNLWIWIFGIILAFILNADAITLSKRFWSDQPLRDAIVAEATDYVKNNPSGPETAAPPTTSQQPGTGTSSTTPAPGSAPAETSEVADLQGSIRRMNLLREHLPGVPLGWCVLHSDKNAAATTKVGEYRAGCWPDLIHPTAGITHVTLAGTDPRIVDLNDGTWWIWKIVGLLATALAISQGAPFWFDLLQKAVNLRLAGAPPPTTAAPDKK